MRQSAASGLHVRLELHPPHSCDKSPPVRTAQGALHQSLHGRNMDMCEDGDPTHTHKLDICELKDLHKLSAHKLGYYSCV